MLSKFFIDNMLVCECEEVPEELKVVDLLHTIPLANCLGYMVCKQIKNRFVFKEYESNGEEIYARFEIVKE